MKDKHEIVERLANSGDAEALERWFENHKKEFVSTSYKLPHLLRDTCRSISVESFKLVMKVLQHADYQEMLLSEIEKYLMLEAACYGNNIELVKYLVAEYELNLLGMDIAHIEQDYLICNLCSYGYLELVKLFVEHGLDIKSVNEKTSSQLMRDTCESKNLDLVKYLIEECEIDVNFETEHKITFLHMACALGNLDLVKYLVEEHKMDVECKMEDNTTTLYLACMEGNLEVVKYLIEQHKMDASYRNDNDKSCLDIACARRNDDVTSYLIETTKSYINLDDDSGKKALSMLASQPEIKFRLIERYYQCNQEQLISLDNLKLLMDLYGKKDMSQKTKMLISKLQHQINPEHLTPEVEGSLPADQIKDLTSILKLYRSKAPGDFKRSSEVASIEVESVLPQDREQLEGPFLKIAGAEDEEGWQISE